MVKPRDYAHEYNSYHGKPAEIKKRAMRNAAHSAVEKRSGPTSADVDHKKPLRKGGTNAPGNVRVSTITKNRGWRKGKTGYD